MANEEKTSVAKKTKDAPDKQDKKPAGNKFVRAIANLPKRMVSAVKNTIAELKKVTWPTRKDLINYTAIVLAFMVVMAVVVGLLDLGASELIALLVKA